MTISPVQQALIDAGYTDLNGNGTIDPDEILLRFLDKNGDGVVDDKDRALASFDFDLNHNGVTSKVEVGACLKLAEKKVEQLEGALTMITIALGQSESPSPSDIDARNMIESELREARNYLKTVRDQYNNTPDDKKGGSQDRDKS